MNNIIKGKSTNSIRVLIIILLCQILLVSFIPIYSFQSQTQETRAEPSMYHAYEEIVTEIFEIQEHNSSIVQVYNLTTTYEGRTLWAVKISDSPQINDSTEQDVLFMAGLEANSLISVEIAMHLLNYLTVSYGTDSAITELINTREIWILPMVNPDGHEYVDNETMNWEKNRRDNVGSFGVNLDRNFGYEWGTDDHSSDVTTSQNYHGTTAFSEPETQAIKSLVESHDFVFSLSFSSSGEVISYPWGYTNSTASGFELLSEISHDMSMYNNYNVMQQSQHLTNRGNANDWLYDEGVLPFTIFAGDEDIPQEGEIESIAQENLEPCIYLLNIADNPERAMTAQWTFMAYMGGDDSLMEKWGIADINEMEIHGSDPYVNIVAQFDRKPGGDDTNGNWVDTRRFLVTKDYDTEIINSPLKGILGETNSGDPQTLLDFVNWSITNYPAENYFLDLWGHGKGWQGVSGDSTSGGDWLEMYELKSILPKFKERVNVVGFDNCNMAMLEVYTTFIGYTDYMVGSEKEEDAVGWPYDRIFGDLKDDPHMVPLDLSKIIAFHYVDWAENYSFYSAAVSVVDMEHLSNMINRTDELARELNRTLSLFYDEIDYAVDKTERYAQRPSPRDLYHFAELVEENVNNTPVKVAARNVMDEFQNLVLANERWTSPHEVPPVPVDHAHGIAIWLYDGSSADFSKYITLDFAMLSFWDEFLSAYKVAPSRPQVSFEMGYTLSDSDSDGNHDTVTFTVNTNVTGLRVSIEMFNSENELMDNLVIESTMEGIDAKVVTTPIDLGLPSDYYSFYIYLENESGIPQNYSEAVEIWLGNERPDIVLTNMTLYRSDGNQVGGLTGKGPIDEENTKISLIVTNSGTNDLTNVKIEILEGENSIYSEHVDLKVGEEKDLTAIWQPKSGIKTIRAFVDPENDFKEINESNNEATETVEVKPKIPVDPLIVRGKIFNRDKINIIGAKVKITNLRTNQSLNRTTTEKGYKADLDPDWYIEGDELEIKASYNSVSANRSVFTYSDDEEIWANITLKTDLYDALFYFKLGLIIFEIIGFILVIKYYINLKRYKPKE
jgi:hypothetical protein